MTDTRRSNERELTAQGRARRSLLRIIGLSSALALAGCGGGAGMGDLFSDFGGGSQNNKQAQPKAPAPGKGGARVALLLPLSAPGTPGQMARQMKNAAEMAMVDAGRPDITLVVKDTAGNPAGARAAAEAALAEGARLILGPLFASSVKEVAARARGKGVPVIAFSSSSSVARPGVYLMSFPPEAEVDNVVRHAARSGKKNIAALLPTSTYGNVVAKALEEAARRYGARIVARERYVRTSLGITEPARRLAAAIPGAGANALFLPEVPKLAAKAGEVLAQSGITPASVQLLGTGFWDSTSARTVSFLNGGWYAGVDPRLVRHFEGKYRQTYGQKPLRVASLAYDATSLAIALKRHGGFTNAAITNREGFQGMNGLFRFRRNGMIERGLAILRVTPTGPQVVKPAPSRFAGY